LEIMGITCPTFDGFGKVSVADFEGALSAANADSALCDDFRRVEL
jgi:hypothetical protein